MPAFLETGRTPSFPKRLPSTLGAPSRPAGARTLPPEALRRAQGATGEDLSGIFVRTDPSLRNVGARAATSGNEIRVLPGIRAHDSAEGHKTLLHEVAHVLQQRRQQILPTRRVQGLGINSSASLENDANRFARTLSLPASSSHGNTDSVPASGQGMVHQLQQVTIQRQGGRGAIEVDLAGSEREVQGHVKSVVNQLVLENRGAELTQLLTGARDHGFTQVENHVARAILAARSNTLSQIPGRIRPLKIGKSDRDPADPGNLPGQIPVKMHGKSHDVLNASPARSSLMGVVHLRNHGGNNSAKVFMHGSEANDDFPLEDPLASMASTYRSPPTPPVTHVNRNIRDPNSPSGHFQVAEKVITAVGSDGRQKFTSKQQDAMRSEHGHFIGFSVVRGSHPLPHQLSFTSATYNPNTFPRNSLGLPFQSSSSSSSSGSGLGSSPSASSSSNAPAKSTGLAQKQNFLSSLAQTVRTGQLLKQQGSASTTHHETHYQTPETWARAISTTVNQDIDPNRFTVTHHGRPLHYLTTPEGGLMSIWAAPHASSPAPASSSSSAPAPVSVAPHSAAPTRPTRRGYPPPIVGGVTFREAKPKRKTRRGSGQD